MELNSNYLSMRNLIQGTEGIQGIDHIRKHILKWTTWY